MASNIKLSFSSRIFAFSKLHQIHLTFGLKETAPISFCLLKLGFLLFRFLLELFFSLFYKYRPLPDSLCLVIHLPVFVFTPLPVRLLTHCSQLAEISVPDALSNKTLSSFVFVLFHLYRTCGFHGKTRTANRGTSGG
jgi:hypothetical protein